MIKSGRQRNRQVLDTAGHLCVLAGWCVLVVLFAARPTWSQDVFSSNGGGNPTTYQDQFSTSCEQGNANNPYAGMDPLSCHGVMAPVDSRNNCSLRMTLLKQVGGTCYYCQQLNPPINGIIIPFDQLRDAGRQGFKCGVDQADPRCMAICTKDGDTQYNPPPGTSIPGPGPESPADPAPPGDVEFGTPQKQCVNQPYDVRADVPDATPQMRYTLGFERGFAGCLESQVTVQNIALAALASRFKGIAALLTVVAAPGVIDAVLHPPGVSFDPNPYQEGTNEGSRLCTWALKISPVAVARCPAAAETGAVCSATSLMSGLRQAYGSTAAEAPKRFDCFLCTLAWLRGDSYRPPANGGSPWRLSQIEQFLQKQYGNQTPQGPPLPCWRQSAQQKGIPGSMSPAGITSEMKNAGDGAQGFVFILDPMYGEIGHVVGVRTQGSGADAQVIFWDEQQQMAGDLWFKPGDWTAFFRTQ